MIPDFDFENMLRAEFLVAFGRGKEPEIRWVRKDESVTQALFSAAQNTYVQMVGISDEPLAFDISNEYPATHYLYFPSDDPLVSKVLYFRDSLDQVELDDPRENLPKISLYFAKLTDGQGKTLTGIKATSDFGRLLKVPRFRVIGGELSLETEPQFQLYDYFDFFVDATHVFILKYKAFESTMSILREVRGASAANLRYLEERFEYLDLSGLGDSVGKSLTNARLLASIKSNRLDEGWSRQGIERYFGLYQVACENRDGRIAIDPASLELALNIISRKLLGIEPTEGNYESYYAPNRHRQALP